MRYAVFSFTLPEWHRQNDWNIDYLNRGFSEYGDIIVNITDMI